jgi:hypothetical protein
MYNPNSGTMTHQHQVIADFLQEKVIPYKFFETKKAGDCFEIPL